ncbi:hypothetical protein B0H19DRAFT_1183260 [Mycena capillaripes]|nr:hypothetical protein B0H19DRAFT_1183260 [Mycena capillaripes]
MILEQRRAFLKHYMKRVIPTPKCGAIGPKTEFMRCSGCLLSNYCSSACQLWDWRHGGHPESCKALLVMRRADIASMGPRDRAFLRAILHDDYLRLKADILAREVECLRANPDEDCYVVFDYSIDPFIPPQVSVEPMSKLDTVFCAYPPLVAKSGGRLRLHIMQVVNGGWTEMWLFPLRFSTCRITTEVELIALEPHSADECRKREDDRARIQRLVELEMKELHV